MPDELKGSAEGATPEPRSLELLEGLIGHRFAELGLLELALTHRSFANEQGLTTHNERLEFLGDAVLGLLVAERLYREHPERAEGDLARAKATLVSAECLAPFGESIGLGSFLRLGVGEARSGGRRKSSLLADGVEAVLGAVHLDGGLEAARRAVDLFLDWTLHHGEPRWVDAKTELQERVQEGGAVLPVYRVVAEEGPEHDKLFTFEVSVHGEVLGRGEGRTKKEAQQGAAAAALAELEARELARAPAGIEDVSPETQRS